MQQNKIWEYCIQNYVSLIDVVVQLVNDSGQWAAQMNNEDIALYNNRHHRMSNSHTILS